MSNQLEELSLELYKRSLSDAPDTMLELLSDDVVINSYAFGMTLRGKEGFQGFIRGFVEAFPDLTLKHSTIISSGNTVATEFTAHGTHTGPLQTPAGPIPATGKTIELKVAEFLVWEDGKLVSLHNYQDGGTIMRQLGVM